MSNAARAFIGTHLRTAAILASTAILCALAYGLLPDELDEPARRAVMVFIIAAVFWATEVIPLYATSLLIIALQVVLLAAEGGLGPAGDINYREFFQPFASPIIILFMGGFLLARAVSKHRLDAAISARVLRPIAHRPVMLVYAIMGMTAFFSMWMSNTATTAMMIALILPLVTRISATDNASPEDAARQVHFARALVLAVPLGANIGGIGTPIGTAPNAVALAALRNAGYDISFVDWMLMAVPLEVALLALAGAVLLYAHPPARDMGPIADEPDSVAATRLTSRGWMTATILTLALAMWLTGNLHGIADAVVALFAATALTALGVLDRRDVDSIDWNILILMWGGLSLGHGMQVTGLVDWIVAMPIFSNADGFVLAGGVVALSVGLSTFMSNTAAANLIVPMALAMSSAAAGVGAEAGDPMLGAELVMLTALSCSLAMALPVSTPPNAIAFSTGRIGAKHLLRVGGAITVLSVIVLLLGYRFVIPFVLR